MNAIPLTLKTIAESPQKKPRIKKLLTGALGYCLLTSALLGTPGFYDRQLVAIGQAPGNNQTLIATDLRRSFILIKSNV